jgi:hypothetical protein
MTLALGEHVPDISVFKLIEGEAFREIAAR